MVMFKGHKPSKEPKRLHRKAQYKAGNPRKLAQNIIKEKLEKDDKLMDVVKKIEVAGPGFINFWLSKEAILDELRKVLKEREKYGSSNLGKRKTVVIDYSSPNIAKRFGIGHMRSTIIGQALYNLYSFLGYKVIGDNHLGDWGTQFGTLLAQIRISNIEIRNLNIEKLPDEEIEEMQAQFRKIHERYTQELLKRAKKRKSAKKKQGLA